MPSSKHFTDRTVSWTPFPISPFDDLFLMTQKPPSMYHLLDSSFKSIKMRIMTLTFGLLRTLKVPNYTSSILLEQRKTEAEVLLS